MQRYTKNALYCKLFLLVGNSLTISVLYRYTY